jgi:hypothetical protein
MISIDHESKRVIRRLVNLLVPPGLKANERRTLAKAAKLSDETLRQLRSRQSFSFETFVRLALARGVPAETLTNLTQTETDRLSEGEAQWLEYGRELNEMEKIQFVELIKFVRNRWERLKPREGTR